ncbi:hypothetical protein NMY22_g4973 [Coprinellus aureogranulatus]|nr:hypothetical protein NMY22_g4973 [Coprinellus aureogranulatus]
MRIAAERRTANPTRKVQPQNTDRDSVQDTSRLLASHFVAERIRNVDEHEFPPDGLSHRRFSILKRFLKGFSSPNQQATDLSLPRCFDGTWFYGLEIFYRSTEVQPITYHPRNAGRYLIGGIRALLRALSDE